MKSKFVSYLYGTVPLGLGRAGLNIPFSPIGISIKITGLIVPAIAMDVTVPPVEAVIVTPFIVTSPFWISTSCTCLTPATSVIEFGSLTLTSKLDWVPFTVLSPMLTSIFLFPPDSPPMFSNLPPLWLNDPPAKILADPFAAKYWYFALPLYLFISSVLWAIQSGPNALLIIFFKSLLLFASCLKQLSLAGFATIILKRFFKFPSAVVSSPIQRSRPAVLSSQPSVIFTFEKYSSTVIEAFLVSFFKSPFISIFPLAEIVPDRLVTFELFPSLPFIERFPPDWIVALSVTAKLLSNTGNSIFITSYLFVGKVWNLYFSVDSNTPVWT